MADETSHSVCDSEQQQTAHSFKTNQTILKNHQSFIVQKLHIEFMQRYFDFLIKF